LISKEDIVAYKRTSTYRTLKYDIPATSSEFRHQNLNKLKKIFIQNMSRQILMSKVKEQVENKVNSILKEKYQEDIAIKLFKSSSEIIRDSIDEVTKSYYGKTRFKKDLKVKISQDWINYFLEK